MGNHIPGLKSVHMLTALKQKTHNLHTLMPHSQRCIFVSVHGIHAQLIAELLNQI